MPLDTSPSGGGGMAIGGAITGGTANRLLLSGATLTELTPGTGILTALAISIGSAGAPVLLNGAGGVPSAVDLTNATSIPAAQLTGSIADARLSANVLLLNASNTLTGTTNTFTLGTTSGTTTTSGIAVTANSLTSGTGLDISSSSTTAAANHKLINITLTGANATNAITTTGMVISNTKTNATSGTNVALTLTASGATTANTALNVTAGDIVAQPSGTNASVIRVLHSDATKRVQLGTLPTSTTYGGLWLGNVTPSISNCAIISDGTTTYINSPGTNFNFDVAGSDIWRLTATQFQCLVATDSTATNNGSLFTAGGIGIAKAVNIGTTLAVTGASTFTGGVVIGASGTAISGSKTFTLTISASITAGTVSSQDITATGVVAGDTCTWPVFDTIQPTGIVVASVRPGTDKITVDFYNADLLASHSLTGVIKVRSLKA